MCMGISALWYLFCVSGITLAVSIPGGGITLLVYGISVRISSWWYLILSGRYHLGGIFDILWISPLWYFIYRDGWYHLSGIYYICRVSSWWYRYICIGYHLYGILLPEQQIKVSPWRYLIYQAVSAWRYLSVSGYQLYGIGMAGAAGSRVKVSLRRYF